MIDQEISKLIEIHQVFLHNILMICNLLVPRFDASYLKEKKKILVSITHRMHNGCSICKVNRVISQKHLNEIVK